MKAATEQDYRRRIARVIDAIGADPGAPHRLETLAGVAHLSAFHFHRIYRHVTGERIGITLRRMRLARAAFRLIGSNESVTRIALDLGYDSPQAFSRAFRGFSGLSPRDFQGLHAELSHRGAGVSIISLPAFPAVGLAHRGPLATIAQAYRDLLVALAPDSPGTLIGICRGNPDIPGDFHYVAAAMIDDPQDSGLERFTLGGGRYAAYRLVGGYGLIAPTFQTLFQRWLPRSGLRPANRPALEFYREPERRGGVLFPVIDLLVPIE
jgi:AraC family transcriptional regulator